MDNKKAPTEVSAIQNYRAFKNVCSNCDMTIITSKPMIFSSTLCGPKTSHKIMVISSPAKIMYFIVLPFRNINKNASSR